MNFWLRIIALLRLARLEQLLPLVGNSWVIVCLAFHVESPGRRNAHLIALGLPGALLAAGAVTLGMGLFALATNDIVDRRRDRMFSPHRPVVTGEVSVPVAGLVAIVSLLIALVAAGCLGQLSMMLALVAAGGILIYNLAGKHMPAVGVVMLGLLGAMNMIVVSPQLGYIWPVWLGMSHIMIVATADHVLRSKRPRLRPIDLAGILAGWLFWTLALFAWMTLRDTTGDDLPWAWLGPGAAAAIYVGLLPWALAAPTKRIARRYAAVALLAMLLFDAGWLIALGMPMLALTLIGLLMTLMAGLYGIRTLARRLSVKGPDYHVESPSLP